MGNENENDGDYNYKVKLICSYGGKIQPRPHDHRLSYVGGETKILAVDRRIKFSDIVAKLISICNASSDVLVKYQLPGEDLDALVSVINDDDLELMMDEYDRIRGVSSKPVRLRIFLFYPNPPMNQKTGSVIAPSSASLNPDFLFGFDKEYEYEYSAPKPEIPWGSGATDLFTPGADPRNAAPIQGMPGRGLILPEKFESHEEVGDHAPGEQLVYRIPVTAGYLAGAGMPAMRVLRPGIVCNGFPVGTIIPATTDEKLGFNAVVGVVPPHTTAVAAGPFSHDSKNNS
ncbi:hypothetical protein NMG60_11006080 [Bertholletia excelsa]